MYVPEESIVGMLLYHQENYYVVKAHGFNILQHDAFRWICDNEAFLKSKLNRHSKNIEYKLTLKLEELAPEIRIKLIKDVFQIFKDNNIKDLKEIKLTNLVKLIRDFAALDKETQALISEFIWLIFISK